MIWAGNTKGGSINVPLNSCFTGLELAVWQLTIFAFDFLCDWFELVCFANKNKNCQLSYSWFQTSQTGGQWYSYTFPFSIPWSEHNPMDLTNSNIAIMWSFEAYVLLARETVTVALPPWLWAVQQQWKMLLNRQGAKTSTATIAACVFAVIIASVNTAFYGSMNK
jgi:hypothetical protein